MANTPVLYFENKISCGNWLKKPAIVAPIPRATKRLGRAQQIKVLVDAKSEIHEVMLFTLFLLSEVEASPFNNFFYFRKR